jgi:aminobenzoyl-glutamate utilization protein B
VNEKNGPFTQDTPAIDMNKAIMDKYRPAVRKYDYDPARDKTCLEQPGVTYPTVKK